MFRFPKSFPIESIWVDLEGWGGVANVIGLKTGCDVNDVLFATRYATRVGAMDYSTSAAILAQINQWNYRLTVI